MGSLLADKERTRRRFLKESMLGGLGIAVLPQSVRANRKVPPSDRITVGTIGVGKKGRGLTEEMARRSDAQVVAVSDVVEERAAFAKSRVEKIIAERDGSGSFQGCDIYADFRALLDRDDIDAVIIGTPDHWHALPCIMAANARKHVYCEKPLTHQIAEGQAIVEAVKRNGITFQTGSQQRSGAFGGTFRRAVNLIWNGRIGELKTIRIGVGDPPIPCELAAEEIPQGTDWNSWVGPAAFTPYNEILCPRGVHNHFPAWRRYREYGNGGLADMGAHHFDIAQWALKQDRSGPVRVEPPLDGSLRGLRFVYQNGVEMIHGGPADCVFEGTEGTIIVSRGAFEAEPVTIAAPLPDVAELVKPSTGHFDDFINSIRSKTQPIADAEIGHRTATVCHLAIIGYQLRRSLDWDPKVEQFRGDSEANTYISQPYREPWTL